MQQNRKGHTDSTALPGTPVTNVLDAFREIPRAWVGVGLHMIDTPEARLTVSVTKSHAPDKTRKQGCLGTPRVG